jgi:hypothetical protein
MDAPKGGKAMDDELMAWAMRPETRPILAAAKAVRDALEHERGANDDDTRRLAHEHVLAAAAALDAATGLRDFSRRRVLSTAVGQPAHGSVSTSKGLEAIFRRSGKNSPRETEQRYAISRILLDRLGALLGGRPENRERVPQAPSPVVAEMLSRPDAPQKQAVSIFWVKALTHE